MQIRQLDASYGRVARVLGWLRRKKYKGVREGHVLPSKSRPSEVWHLRKNLQAEQSILGGSSPSGVLHLDWGAHREELE